MANIERDDGTLFISPSYREIITAKKKSLLKKEVVMLSQNYGEYAFIRKKNASQYEVVFNNEGGYLLGESIWKFFDKENDLIYCERLNNSKDAILVIIKSGSIYLDTKISIENIGEELIALRSQKNKYNIYLFGEIPISEKPSTTKFFFDEDSVASFNYLSESVFDTLPTYENIKLQPIKKSLSASGMGPIPIRPIVTGIIVIIVIYAGFNFIKTHKKSLPKILVGVVDPYARFVATMTTPNPKAEIEQYVANLHELYTIPGAQIENLSFNKENKQVLTGMIRPNNVSLSLLYSWNRAKGFNLDVDNTGVHVNKTVYLANRTAPKSIFNIQNVLRIFIDRVKTSGFGSEKIALGEETQYSQYKEIPINISFSNVTPNSLLILANNFKDLPMIFNSMQTTVKNGLITGSIKLTIVGS